MKTNNCSVNIVEILRNIPIGTKLYSPIFGQYGIGKFGDCYFGGIVKRGGIDTIKVDYEAVTVYQGCTSISQYLDETCTKCVGEDGETGHIGQCALFPSREIRDWVGYNPKPHF